MFSRILVPLDGSAAAERALEYAASLAKTGNGQIILLRARSSPMTVGFAVDYPIPQEVFEAELKTCQDYVLGVEKRLQAEGCRTAIELPAGEPSECILGVAEQDRCDLIVMSSHGRTGFNRFLLGSVAEKVARHACCPVMIVGRHSPNSQPPDV